MCCVQRHHISASESEAGAYVFDLGKITLSECDWGCKVYEILRFMVNFKLTLQSRDIRVCKGKSV